MMKPNIIGNLWLLPLRGISLRNVFNIRIVETLALWQQLQPQCMSNPTHRQQLEDMILWCTENIDEDGRALCLCVRGALDMNTVTFSNSVDWLSERFTCDAKEAQQDNLLKIKPWDLAQYLGISDYLYI